jgi:hypothetical protein
MIMDVHNRRPFYRSPATRSSRMPGLAFSHTLITPMSIVCSNELMCGFPDAPTNVTSLSAHRWLGMHRDNSEIPRQRAKSRRSCRYVQVGMCLRTSGQAHVSSPTQPATAPPPHLGRNSIPSFLLSFLLCYLTVVLPHPHAPSRSISRSPFRPLSLRFRYPDHFIESLQIGTFQSASPAPFARSRFMPIRAFRTPWLE